MSRQSRIKDFMLGPSGTSPFLVYYRSVTPGPGLRPPAVLLSTHLLIKGRARPPLKHEIRRFELWAPHRRRLRSRACAADG